MSVTALSVFTLVVALSAVAFAQEGGTPQMEERKAIAQKAKAMFEEADSFAAIQWVAGHDPVTAVSVLHALQQDAYWNGKNLYRSTAMGRAGLQLGLTEAAKLAATGKAGADEILAIAKGCAYDMGSFTWPGWDEADIVIGPNDAAMGFDAAKANLRLAIELKKPDEPMSRAWWLLGAHQLNAGYFEQATESFQKAAAFAEKAGMKGSQLMNIGYVQVVAMLAAPNDEKLKADFESLKADLKNDRDGEFFNQQLDTTLKFFSRSRR